MGICIANSTLGLIAYRSLEVSIVVPSDAVVLGDLSHQLVCRRVMPATEQRFQSKLLPDPKRQSLVAQLHARSRRYGLEHGCCAWEQ